MPSLSLFSQLNSIHPQIHQAPPDVFSLGIHQPAADALSLQISQPVADLFDVAIQVSEKGICCLVGN